MPIVTQIKLFKGWYSETVKDENNLEKLVNDWLTEHAHLEIVDIKFDGRIETYQSRAGNSLAGSCLVTYRIDPEEEIRREEERKAEEEKQRSYEEIGRVLKQVTKEVVAEYQDKEPDQ